MHKLANSRGNLKLLICTKLKFVGYGTRPALLSTKNNFLNSLHLTLLVGFGF